MSLAKAFLQNGEQEIVLEYFELVSKYRKTDKLTERAETVKRDGMLDFGANQEYEIRGGLIERRRRW